ncbi:hypothetical protein BKA62DRAFT_770299 [Auriculariales sp. MPI-PUGE-AT-0066]|nr:hypothetical protein BKA62DRAFT_770299 [Auriculariales sp. MPI-PUGE-AT-0066]
MATTDCAFFPPAYQPSSTSPSYSQRRQRGEISLACSISPRSRRRRDNHTIVREYSHKTHGFSVAFVRLHDASSPTPTYQQTDLVEGHVQIHNHNNSTIIGVSVRLDGQLEIAIAGRGANLTSFLRTDHDIWNQQLERSSGSVPERIGFTIPIPVALEDNGLLPSSIDTGLISGVRAVVRLSIPIKYVRQDHPPLPHLPRDLDFLSTVKTAPEGWSVVYMDIPTSCKPLELSIALPASRVFCVSQPISIHLQLSGNATALQQFIAPYPASSSNEMLSRSRAESIADAAFYRLSRLPAGQQAFIFDLQGYGARLGSPSPIGPDIVHDIHHRPLSKNQRSHNPLENVSALIGDKPRTMCAVEICLQRHISVELLGEVVQHRQCLSPLAQLELVREEISAGWLAWNGIIQPSPPESWSPTSRIGGLVIKDLISIRIRASSASSSQSEQPRVSVRPHAQLIPVKLVTDPYPTSEYVNSLYEAAVDVF